MTKDKQTTQYMEPHTKRCSRLRASAPRRSNAYYNAFVTAKYNPDQGIKEAHEARYLARLSVLHSENRSLAQEAVKDLRLHGQWITRRTVKTINNCECPSNLLICLCR